MDSFFFSGHGLLLLLWLYFNQTRFIFLRIQVSIYNYFPSLFNRFMENITTLSPFGLEKSETFLSSLERKSSTLTSNKLSHSRYFIPSILSWEKLQLFTWNYPYRDYNKCMECFGIFLNGELWYWVHNVIVLVLSNEGLNQTPQQCGYEGLNIF